MKLFRKEEAFRLLVIAAMMTCVASAASELAKRVLPGLEPAPLIVLAFLVCLEGIATDRLARQLPEAAARTRLRLVEWAVILVLLRLVASLSRGLEGLAADAHRWLARPQSLLDGGLLAGAALLVAVWGLGLGLARALEALGPEADAPPPKESAAYYAWLTRPRAEGHDAGWQNLLQLFLWGGLLLLVCSGLARLDLQLALSLKNPAIAGIVGNVLLYFVLGFTLLGQGHYAMLRSRWERNHVEVTRPMASRWAALALAFVAGVALLVLLLPVRPSLALFSAAFDVFEVGFSFVMRLVLSVFGLAAYLFGLLMSLLGFRLAPEGAEESVPAIPPPAVPPAVQRVGWWQAIQGFVLWAVILSVAIYALVRFARERRVLWRELAARITPLGWIASLLGTLWRWLTRSGSQLRASWRALLARRVTIGEEAQPHRPAWFRPRNAREQVRLLYLLFLHEGARLGWPRPQSATPFEYAERVVPQLAEGEEDVQALTEAFVEARYSQRSFDRGEVGPLRATYRRLRQAWHRIAGRKEPSAPTAASALEESRKT